MKPGATTRRLALARGFAGVALIGYPVLVWIGLMRWSPRVLALVLLCVLLPLVTLRFRSGPRHDARRAMRGLAALPLVTVAGLILAAVLDARASMLVVPVAINGALLVAFAATLASGSVPMIERFAHLQRNDLSAEQRAWCRHWTRIWCLFFVLNGTAALALAIAAPLAWWATYNGLVAYALIGLLLATEWVLRRRRFGADASGPRAAGGAGERDARLGGSVGAPGGRTDDPRVPHADP